MLDEKTEAIAQLRSHTIKYYLTSLTGSPRFGCNIADMALGYNHSFIPSQEKCLQALSIMA